MTMNNTDALALAIAGLERIVRGQPGDALYVAELTLRLLEAMHEAGETPRLNSGEDPAKSLDLK